MKILFVEQFSELGGGQQCLLDLLPAIQDRGWHATLAAPGDGPLFEKSPVETVRIQLDITRFVPDSVRLAKWIAAHDADLIWLSAPRPLIAAAFGARGRPVIFHAQHFFNERYKLSLARWAIRKARATVIADSKYVAAQYQAAHIVYNGVAEIPFAAPKGGHTIGIIGRIAPMKGQTDFLRAAEIIARQWPDARFVICGSPMFSSPEYMDEVTRLASGLPVDFLGWRDDIAAVLPTLDLLVVPSKSAEATTRVILEAFSAGVPVVAYAAGGIPEIIHDNENGFLVPECSPAALAEKILTAHDLPAIATRARTAYDRNYTLAHYREQMLQIICDVGRPF